MANLHLAKEIFNLIYPVGSIYISVNNINPSTLFGGTWEEIRGVFLLGHDPNTTMQYKTLGAKYGSWNTSDTALTIDQIPSHSHKTWLGTAGGAQETLGSGDRTVHNWGSTEALEATGGGKGHNHKFCPPVLVVKMWKRTA